MEDNLLNLQDLRGVNSNLCLSVKFLWETKKKKKKYEKEIYSSRNSCH